MLTFWRNISSTVTVQGRTSRVVSVFNLATRRLYLCVGVRDDMGHFLPAALRGGVDVVQLREKTLDIEAQRVTALVMGPICRSFDVPFIVNDSPELAFDVGADGVHVGQEDVSVDRCRELLGNAAIVGLSTHSSDEFDRALLENASYFSAGPIEPTPTKPGRGGTGIDYAVASQKRSARPVFVTGGVNAANVATLVAAGLRHFVVVRALTEASDPEASARSIRHALDHALAMTVEPT
jgi:thiamine-phosphate pyrophosphorylase